MEAEISYGGHRTIFPEMKRKVNDAIIANFTTGHLASREKKSATKYGKKKQSQSI